MDESGPLIRNVSDTALWVAVYRARETERPDALFRDPFAGRLAGVRGVQIATSMPFADKATWAWVARTVLFDQCSSPARSPPAPSSASLSTCPTSPAAEGCSTAWDEARAAPSSSRRASSST